MIITKNYVLFLLVTSYMFIIINNYKKDFGYYKIQIPTKSYCQSIKIISVSTVLPTLLSLKYHSDTDGGNAFIPWIGNIIFNFKAKINHSIRKTILN